MVSRVRHPRRPQLDTLEGRLAPSSVSTFPAHFYFLTGSGEYAAVHVNPSQSHGQIQEIHYTDHPPQGWVQNYP